MLRSSRKAAAAASSSLSSCRSLAASAVLSSFSYPLMESTSLPQGSSSARRAFLTFNARRRNAGGYHRPSPSGDPIRVCSARSISSASSIHDSNRLIVVGSGIAGSSAALIAAETHSIPVTLLHAGSTPTDCNSYWAQGGIIYRNYDPSSRDSAESLMSDVIRAGAGLCREDAVRKLAQDGPRRVRELLLGSVEKFADVPFDRDERGELQCCLEASHSAPRIIHYADHTGKAITNHITSAVRNHPLITIVPDTIVTDLLTNDCSSSQKETICIGTRTLNKVTKEYVDLYSTRGTVLASGGLGGIYEHSTNPPGFNALGSSASLAIRAGARTADMEYVQFHPTSLFIPNESRFLLTEALRGEGAILRNGEGRAFAKEFHEDGELAPRDIVARGVYMESQKPNPNGGHNVFLDIRHRDPVWLKNRFPSINAHLRSKGLDMTSDVLPVIPAAHYTCGGIDTDLYGRTTVIGLYAAGEAARTGVHGGNRLASTSLLEGLVFGASVADFVGKSADGREASEMARLAIESCTVAVNGRQARPFSVATREAATAASSLLVKLRKTMWDDVGVVRTTSGLSNAMMVLSDIKEEASELYESCPTSIETIGVRDAAYAGEAVAMAAYGNRVSAGAHCISLNEDEAQGGQQGRHLDSDSDTSDDDDDDDMVEAAAIGAR